MDNSTVKSIVKKFDRIISFLYRLFGRNHFSIQKGNTLKMGNAFLKNCSITVRGKGNIIEIEPSLTRMTTSSIKIKGNNCRVSVGGGGNFVNCHLFLDSDGSEIMISEHVTICGKTELAAIEGCRIIIGADCLFSSDINLRTGDSHSIINLETGERINPSKNIEIGNHVWIGNDVKILKGVKIGEHSIVSTGAILSSGEYPSYSVIGGIGHGKILKENIDWDHKRL